MDNILEESLRLERAGNIEQACSMRWSAAQKIIEGLDDDMPEADWEESKDELMLLNASAIDHFLAGDWELAAALWETVLDLDPEDHLDASRHLAYCYIEMGEWELLDETLFDISDKSADKPLLSLLSAWLQTGDLPAEQLRHLRQDFAPYYRELTSAEHPADENYLRDIASPRPARETLAREFWFETEHFWNLHRDFLEALGDID